MIKNLKKVVLLAFALFGMGTAMAQMEQIPVDPAVRIGTLSNGLTYYIQHNETPKGQADFFIAQKVGSVLEEDNQRGLAHFLEHMCFNGTTHYPGSSLIDYLESIGVKFGQNLNAYTSVDETVYNISSVPVARKSVQDSCLLVLHDWANDLLLEPEEIDKERGVIHEEWRMRNVGQLRALTELLPTIYPNGNRYGVRMPIGTMEVVDNFPYQALRDYYETWYRPDQQAVIVVGDIDVDYIEGKIKEMFADIEMPANPKERVYYEVEDTPGTIYAIGADPEITNQVIEMMFKLPAFPKEMKTNPQYAVMRYINSMITSMLSSRLSDIAATPDAPFAGAGAGYGNFLISNTADALELSVVGKGNDILPGFETAYRELLRAQRGGFTVSEYERARAEFLSRLEKRYNSRDKQQSTGLAQKYARHFIDNEPIPSVEDEYQFMSMIAPMIPVEAINSVLPQYITNDNRVVLGLFPEKEGIKVPTDAEIAYIVAKVDAEEIEPYKDEVKAEPLIPALPAPGKVVSIEDMPQWDAKLITLSNGVQVVVKTTDLKKDEILFDAVAIGGTSTVPDSQAANLLTLSLFTDDNHGLGDYNAMDLKKYLQGKQVGVQFGFSDYMREVEGTSTVKDLPTLMELIYMTFVDFTITEDDYASAINSTSSILANQEANPQYTFQKNVTKNIYKSAAKQTLTVADLAAAEREGILKLVHDNLANAADYRFYFVGDVTVEQITPLLEQYIATLPANAATASKSFVTSADHDLTTGACTDISTTTMQNPQTWFATIIDGTMPFTPANRAIASLAGQVLSNRLHKKVREEMGATYSIGAAGRMLRQGDVNVLFQIVAPMKPELKDAVLVEVDKIVQDTRDNITPEELNSYKEFMVKEAIANKEKNSAWLGAMVGYFTNGVDTFNGDADVINAVTADQVAKFFDDVLAQGNRRVIILDPAE